MELDKGRNLYLRILLIGLVLAVVILGIQPAYRDVWLLENLLSLLAVVLLFFSHRRWPLSNASYTLLAIFALFHSVGSHYSYSEVPYERWLHSLTGVDLHSLFGIERNHYDRLVHFLFGALWFHPLRELILRATPVDRLTSYLYPLALLGTASHCYELLEWIAAELFGGDLGMAYLGSQGDVWDAQKDMGMALIGSLLAALVEMGWERRRAAPAMGQ